MKKTVLSLSVLALTALLGSAYAAEISIACGAVGDELKFCQTGAAAWAKKTGNTVKVVQSPNLTNDRLGLYQQSLAAKSSDIDVYQLDVVWPGLLGQHFIDLKPFFTKEEIAAHFPRIISNNTIGNKLVAIPWFTDAGLLYYRTDLLKKYGITAAPKTWEELQAAALKVQDGERKAGNAGFQGFVFQGKNYEGLTCDALEWVFSYGGGTIVDPSGKVTINNPKAVAALKAAASWVKNISPEGVTTYGEEDARGIFQAGNAAFMRNWPYAWSLGQKDGSKVQGMIGVVPLPKGGADGQNAATLGGWQLGVSKYSKNQKIAADLVKYLAGPEEQKRRAIEGSYNPTIASLYKDADVLKAAPFFGSLYDVFTNAVARPSSPTKGKYNQVSNAFASSVHDVLTGKNTAETALSSLATQLERIKGRRWQ